MPFMDRLRAATETAAARAKTELEALQKRRELTQAYADLGRKTAELVDAGTLTDPALVEARGRIKTLQAELDALGADEQGPTE